MGVNPHRGIWECVGISKIRKSIATYQSYTKDNRNLSSKAWGGASFYIHYRTLGSGIVRHLCVVRSTTGTVWECSWVGKIMWRVQLDRYSCVRLG